jgi:hypothetical protein
MKFISKILILFLLLQTGCTNSDISQFPPYKIIKKFSGRIKQETGLRLSSYGANSGLSEKYKKIYGKANFDMLYVLIKNRKESINLDEARCLITSVSESFINEVNSDPSMHQYTDIYPITSDFIEITILFVDEERIELGSGICNVSLLDGIIKYDSYNIEEYRRNGRYPSAIGEHILVHQESYAEALDIVKKQNCLKQL